VCRLTPLTKGKHTSSWIKKVTEKGKPTVLWPRVLTLKGKKTKAQGTTAARCQGFGCLDKNTKRMNSQFEGNAIDVPEDIKFALLKATTTWDGQHAGKAYKNSCMITSQAFPTLGTVPNAKGDIVIASANINKLTVCQFQPSDFESNGKEREGAEMRCDSSRVITRCKTTATLTGQDASAISLANFAAYLPNPVDPGTPFTADSMLGIISQKFRDALGLAFDQDCDDVVRRSVAVQV